MKVPKIFKEQTDKFFSNEEEYSEWKYRYEEAATILVDKEIQRAKAEFVVGAGFYGVVSFVAVGVGCVLTTVFENPAPLLIPAVAITISSFGAKREHKIYAKKKKFRQRDILAKMDKLNKKYPHDSSTQAILNMEEILELTRGILTRGK